MPKRDDPNSPMTAIRRRAASFWLWLFFWASGRAPWLERFLRPAELEITWAFSKSIRNGTLANAKRILGSRSTLRQQTKLARAVLMNFIRFCVDIARSRQMSREQIVSQISAIHGDEHFTKAREKKRGIIIVTAHLGSFEVGMAALRQREPKIHVVFRRDEFDDFNRLRSELHARLDIHEAILDHGWTVWIRLRDALLADEAVVMQGDRVLPGQKGQRVPFLGGHIEMPTGQVKLAAVTGSPILPVFCVRDSDNRMQLFVEPAICGKDKDALEQLARVIEKYVRRYPEQWLMLHPACVEDQIAHF
jgi:KDO2-lipid IV(A) lauroyltransferase